MPKNKLTHWKYQLHYDMIGADMSGKINHPQVVMKEFIESMKIDNIEIKILEAEPVSIGDCWLFLIKCSTPWLTSKLPSYITHQGLGNDKEGIFE